jgi:GMP synthase-like glutamine amidotransferase
MADAPAHFAMRAVHQDQVIAPPPGATVLARSSFCEYAALAYGDPESPDAISLQPHPEFGPEFLDELLALRAGTTFSLADLEAARPHLDKPVASADWARWIVAYLRRVEAAATAA